MQQQSEQLSAFLNDFLRSDGVVEIGEMWSPAHGWRPYMRVGPKALCMVPRAFRKLGEKCRDDPRSSDDVRAFGRDMIASANRAKALNDRGAIPSTSGSSAVN